MRILFTPMPWPSHYFMMVTTAWACRTAGHEVLVAAQPSVLGTVTATGMNAVAVGGDYDVVREMAELQRRAREEAGSAVPPDPERLRALALVPHTAAAEAGADDLVALVRDWRPDLVVSDPLILAAPLAAEAVGARLVRHLWGPDVMRLLGFPGSGMSTEDWPEPLVRLYERFGVKPQEEPAAANLDPTPASMQLDGVPSRVPVRYLPYNGTGVIPAWVRAPARRPRVLVSWGTVATGRLGAEGFQVPAVLAALSGMDVEVVVAVKKADRELLGEPGGDVRVVEDLPLNAVMPSCAAIVHQGGGGTLLTAAYHGVPQVAVPAAADHKIYVGQLLGTGAGVGVGAENLDPDELRDAVSTVLSAEDVRKAAGQLREEMLAQPTPAEVVATLPNLLG